MTWSMVGHKDGHTGHDYFLNSTCNMEENKQQKYAMFAFLKIDM